MPSNALLRRAAVATIVAAVCLGCSADEVTAPIPTSMSATLDGVTFVADAMTANFVVSDGGTRLLVSGVETMGDRTKQLSVEMGGWRGVGAYAIDSNTGLGFIVLNEPITSGPPGAPTSRRWETKSDDVGELVITEFDEDRRRIAGTFRFRAENASSEVIEVSNGTFAGRLSIDP